MRVTIARPNMMPSEDDRRNADFRPTGLMERISRMLENSPEEPNQSELFKALKEDGSGARTAVMSKAVSLLLQEGFVSNRSGRNNRSIFKSVRPYRQIDDPKSDAYVDRMSREEASELDDENHLEI